MRGVWVCPENRRKLNKSLQPALGFLLVPECFSFVIQLLCFDSIWQQCEYFLSAPSLGCTAGSRPSLPVSRWVSCYLSLWISSWEHDPVVGTELLSRVCVCVSAPKGYPYQYCKHWDCTICGPGMELASMAAAATVSICDNKLEVLHSSSENRLKLVLLNCWLSSDWEKVPPISFSVLKVTGFFWEERGKGKVSRPFS